MVAGQDKNLTMATTRFAALQVRDGSVSCSH
jgi:hypothetical protein